MAGDVERSLGDGPAGDGVEVAAHTRGRPRCRLSKRSASGPTAKRLTSLPDAQVVDERCAVGQSGIVSGATVHPLVSVLVPKVGTGRSGEKGNEGEDGEHGSWCRCVGGSACGFVRCDVSGSGHLGLHLYASGRPDGRVSSTTSGLRMRAL